MTITAITIENFKSIKKPVRVEFKPITLLFGPNSAGKSTIVQALHYAREIFERGNLNPDTTLLGGGSIDLGGFESLVHRHDKKSAIRLALELDLTKEDLPVYHDGEIEFLGTGLLDNAGSGHLLDTLSRVQNAEVEVVVAWSEQLEKPYVSSYAVKANGHDLITVTSSPDALQIHISQLNPFSPIFFDEKVKPEDARRHVLSYIIDGTGSVNAETDEFWADVATSDLGSMFTPLLHYMNFDEGIPGLNQPINLLRQKSAVPRWEKNLVLDNSIFADDIEVEDQPNFIRLLSSLAVGPGELVRDGLRRLCYVGPLREVPARNHKPAKSPEESRWANGIAAYDTLFSSSDEFINRVNEWLNREDHLNTGYSVEVKKYRELETDSPLMLAVLQDRLLDDDLDLREQLLALPVMRRLLIRDESADIELAPHDIGVGISQVLPVVVAALHHKNGLVAIEQPELHIHPALQVALGDLFIEQIREYPDLTFLLETHSEHLMLRLLRRIRETGEDEAPENRTLKPEELSIYFVEQGNEGISCHSIRVDEDGDFLDRWPRGFFGERAGELF